MKLKGKIKKVGSGKSHSYSRIPAQSHGGRANGRAVVRRPPRVGTGKAMKY